MSGRYDNRDERRYHSQVGRSSERYYGREEDRYRGRRGAEDDEYSARGYGGRERGSERDFLERAGDEVRSWFGDEEAERRRRMDERRDRQSYGREGTRYGGRGEDDREDYYGGSYDTPSGRGHGADRYEEGSANGRERGYGESSDGRQGGYGSGYSVSYGGGRGYRRSGRAFPAGRGEERESSYGGSGDNSGRRGYSGGGDFGRGRGVSGWSYTEVWLLPGPHTGRGPRGYRRPDERIAEEVNERLTRHGQLDAGDIEVSVQDGEVTLKGTVESRWAKRTAEDTAESVSGVKQVHNQLRVGQNTQNARSREGQERRQGDGEQPRKVASATAASA